MGNKVETKTIKILILKFNQTILRFTEKIKFKSYNILFLTYIYNYFYKFIILISSILWWSIWELIGTRSIWTKIFPESKEITDDKKYKKPTTIGIWIFSIYFALLGYANSRYEIILSRYNYQFNSLNTQLASGMQFNSDMVKSIGDLKIPCDPSIDLEIKKHFNIFSTFVKPLINSLFFTEKYYAKHMNFIHSKFDTKDNNYENKKISSSDDFLLTMTELWKFNLKKANIKEANLQGAILDTANLQEAHLEGANLQGAHLERANLQDAILIGAALQGAHLEGAILQGAMLNEATLQGANLEGANLQGATFFNANLQGASLEGANLQEAVLNKAILQGANLEGANLQGAVLDSANLEGSRLFKANLKRAIIQGANLKQAILEVADLEKADLVNSNLEEAILTRSNLEGARFGWANLKGTMLNEANLMDAGISQDQLLSARSLFDIKGLPPHTNKALRTNHPDLFRPTY